ncbi:MAG: hypothetical protein IPI53_13735 [Saprospiraceae bacterium]|nr:hypothetical protein [Saprospiraceae bacterium]
MKYYNSYVQNTYFATASVCSSDPPGINPATSASIIILIQIIPDVSGQEFKIFY